MTQARYALVIDDQLGVPDSLHQKAFLRLYAQLHWGFVFESCRTECGYKPNRAIEAVIAARNIDLVLLDLRFGERVRLGFEILPRLTNTFPSIPVLILSEADRDVASLGRCLEDGAIGFVRKGLPAADFAHSLDRALAVARSHVLLGQSPPLRLLRRQVARLSPYDNIPVLIVGERGTGKERVARYIHHNGPRSAGPFIPVNCAGLPESLLDAELFGSEKGAYTGAESTRAGYLERADGGVLFLDEVGSMPLSLQAKLLRVLQERSFRRLGVTNEEITIDFQVICATNADPVALMQAGKLREDFYDRVAAVTVQTPPLRECRSDITELVEHFLRQLGLAEKKKIAGEVLEAFAKRNWPGNMRELQCAVQECVVMSEDESVIGVEHLPARLRPPIRAGAATADIGADELVSPARERLLAELRIALEVKRSAQAKKGTHWKAEFMRRLYPHCKAQTAKGFQDLVRRLTKGPWGDPSLSTDAELSALLHELQE